MCRWAAYRGPDLFLESIVTAPCHSLIAQSHQAAEAKSPTNGDGFGVAWYGERMEPGLYRDILPAWSDPNLKSLCGQIRSRLFLAHVRASTGGGTSRANCHPFVSGRWSFMHNGQIGGFEKIRRRLEAGLPDHLYEQRLGTTDSELFFLMMLQEGLDRDPTSAVASAVRRVAGAARLAGLAPDLKLTAAFSDGDKLYAVRHASDGVAPTLYASSVERSGGGHCLVSEPLDREGGCWEAVPAGSFVSVDDRGMAISRFAPEEKALRLAG